MPSPVVDVKEERILAVLRTIHLNLRKKEYQRALETLERFIFEIVEISPGDPVSVLPLECQLVDKLEEVGIRTVQALKNSSYNDLINIPSFGPAKVDKIRDTLRELGIRCRF